MDTVTLSLEKYEEMKLEIEILKVQVKQKTIIKYSAREDIKAVAAAIIVVGIFIALALNHII